jgi:hypothetical protein
LVVNITAFEVVTIKETFYGIDPTDASAHSPLYSEIGAFSIASGFCVTIAQCAEELPRHSFFSESSRRKSRRLSPAAFSVHDTIKVRQ